MAERNEKTIPPRRLAVQTLIRILDEGELSHHAEEQALEGSPGLNDRDRAFFHRIVKTVLENLYRIDHVIDSHASTPARKMKSLIRGELRVAVCQILFFDQIPDSAAVNEAVADVKRSKLRSLAGFVNAVLRAVVRDPERDKLPEEEDSAEYLSVRYSMPVWIAEHFLKLYGAKDTAKIFAYFNSEHGISVHVNTGHPCRTDEEKEEKIRLVRESLEAEGVTVRPGSEPECLQLFRVAGAEGSAGISAAGIARTDAFRTGQITVQDESSYLAVKAACEELLREDLQEGLVSKQYAEPGCSPRYVVYDVCAAPGGKSLTAAELLGPDAEIHAFDLSERKCALIRENIARSGYGNVSAAVRDARSKALAKGTLADPEHGALPAESCDLLICDLPCSGLGIMGRKKDIRYRLKQSDLEDLAALQRHILTAAVDLLKPGGVMMYSTCTIDPLENEEQAGWIEERFGLIPCGSRQFLPGADDCDGFYYALFRRPAYHSLKGDGSI